MAEIKVDLLDKSERAYVQEACPELRLTLRQLWAEIDLRWTEHGCSEDESDKEKLTSFYNDRVWLLNALFSEYDCDSIEIRRRICDYVSLVSPSIVVDYGGGCSAVCRDLAVHLIDSKFMIVEPYPPALGKRLAEGLDNVEYVSTVSSGVCDIALCLDVIEHVHDPMRILFSLRDMIDNAEHVIIASCFYPVVKCHLKRNFHLRKTFKFFARLAGLELVKRIEGSHAEVYRATWRIRGEWFEALVRRLENVCSLTIGRVILVRE